MSQNLTQRFQGNEAVAMQHAMAVGADDRQFIERCDATRFGQRDWINVMDFNEAVAENAVDRCKVERANFADQAVAAGKDLSDFVSDKSGCALAVQMRPEFRSSLWSTTILLRGQLGTAWIVSYFQNHDADLACCAAQPFDVTVILVPDQTFPISSVGKANPEDSIASFVDANFIRVAPVMTGEIGELFAYTVWISIPRSPIDCVDPAQLVQQFGQSDDFCVVTPRQFRVSAHVKFQCEDMLLPSPFDVSCHFDTSETTFNRVFRVSARGCVL